MSSFGSIYFFVQALEHHNALLVVPLYQTFWMLTSIVGGGTNIRYMHTDPCTDPYTGPYLSLALFGGIYFDEFKLFQLLNYIMFPVRTLNTDPYTDPY